MTSPPLAETTSTPTTEVFPSRDFRALWAALGVSQLGTAVSAVAIPLIAVLALGASPAQMSLLVAIELAPAFLIRIPAATWSDSLTSRVPLMTACNVVRAAIVGLVPLLWWFDALSFGFLLLVIGVGSLLTGVYASLSTPVLVDVVPPAHLVSANGRMSATRSVADVSGPALGGALLAILAAPFVVIADAVSFLLSAVLLTRVREQRGRVAARSDAPRPAGRRTGDLTRLGSALVRRSGFRALLVVAFCNGAAEPVLVLFLVHDLQLLPSVIGLLLALGALGGVTGGLLVGRIISGRGPGTALSVGVACMLVAFAVLPFGVAGSSGAVAVIGFELAGSFGGTVLIATVFGTLQGAAPPGKVARVMALAMTFLQVAAVVGALVGGLLGTFVGPRATIAVLAVVLFGSLAPVLLWWRARNWQVDPDKEW